MTVPNSHRLERWPPFVSRWLGYRAHKPEPLPKPLVWFWSFIGAFCGLAVLQAVFGHAEYFINRRVPQIIASYGASAVLCYGAIEAPLAQPRALMAGHFISALVGVCIAKLFGLLHDDSRFAQLSWLAASLATAVSIVLMQITETTHPPAGATALLPIVDRDVFDLGWYYLPVILLSSTLVLATAMLINNIQRRYPVFWIQPAIPAVAKPSPALGGPEKDLEAASSSEIAKGEVDAVPAIASTAVKV